MSINTQDITNNDIWYVIPTNTPYFPTESDNSQDITTANTWYITPTNVAYMPIESNNTQDITTEDRWWEARTPPPLNTTYFPTYHTRIPLTCVFG